MKRTRFSEEQMVKILRNKPNPAPFTHAARPHTAHGGTR